MGVDSPRMCESALMQSKNKTEAQPCDGCEMDPPPSTEGKKEVHADTKQNENQKS